MPLASPAIATCAVALGFYSSKGIRQQATCLKTITSLPDIAVSTNNICDADLPQVVGIQMRESLIPASLVCVHWALSRLELGQSR